MSAFHDPPISLRNHYAPLGQEHLIFPGRHNYLTLHEILDVFPGGFATQDRFLQAGLTWRWLVSSEGTPGETRNLSEGIPRDCKIIAVLESEANTPTGNASTTQVSPARSYHSMADATSASATARITNSQNNQGRLSRAQSAVTNYTHASDSALSNPCSRPLADLDSDVQSARRPQLPSPVALTLPSANSNGTSGSSITAWGSPNNGLATHRSEHLISMQEHQAGLLQGQYRTKFIEDLLSASDSPVPMERYKALIRLMSSLKRQQSQASLSQTWRPGAWESHHELLKQVIMVGECLARFGTADFMGHMGGNNSSRAINTKDYAKLLTQYLESNGPMFDMAFIAHLPQNLQDEAMGVRSLLQTRCETNNIIFGQLIKHVGLEGQGNGSAVVYNSSVLTANPVNKVINETKNLVNAAATAMAKIKDNKTQRALIAAVAGVLGLWILKGKLGGGKVKDSGGRTRRHKISETEEEEDDWRGRRGRTATERLIYGSSATERLAVAHMAACSEELSRAQKNAELLANDWRLGQMRLTPGSAPPGFEPVDGNRCSLHGYLMSVDPKLRAPPPAPAASTQPPAPPSMLPSLDALRLVQSLKGNASKSSQDDAEA
eukprot:gene25890-11563_t